MPSVEIARIAIDKEVTESHIEAVELATKLGHTVTAKVITTGDDQFVVLEAETPG